MLRKLLIILALGLVLIKLATQQQPNASPNLTFTTLNGDFVSLNTWRNKAVLITFWATDCPSCVAEIPMLRELYQQFHPQGLEILAIAMYYDPPSHVVSLTAEQQIPYPVVLDTRAEYAQAFGNIQLVPTILLIAPNGQIVFQHSGQLLKAQLTALISLFLPTATITNTP